MNKTIAMLLIVQNVLLALIVLNTTPRSVASSVQPVRIESVGPGLAYRPLPVKIVTNRRTMSP